MSPIHFTWQEIQSAEQSPTYRSSGDDRSGGGGAFTLTPSNKSHGKEDPKRVEIFVSKAALMKALLVCSYCMICGVQNILPALKVINFPAPPTF